MTDLRMRRFVMIGLFAAAFMAGPAAGAEDEAWPDLKEALFGDRPIAAGEGVVRLEAPYRAYDAAIVPITMVAEVPQTPERYIRSVTLIIDNNPAPVAAVVITRRLDRSPR